MKTEFKLKTLAVGLFVSSMVACTGKTSVDNTSCAGDTTCCSKDSVCNKNKEMTLRIDREYFVIKYDLSILNKLKLKFNN